MWTRERKSGPTLRLETARLVLQPLAYAMHEQDRRELAVAEAAELVRTPLGEVPTVRAVAPTPERFFDLVRDECGVLMSRDLGRIEFVHLSFQEYLAAFHVSDYGLGRALAERAGDPRWEEVILLAMSRPGVFEPFMTRALERDGLDAALLRQCLRETLRILPAPFEAAADRALARLRTPDGPLARFGRWLLQRPAPVAAAGELRRIFELVLGYDLPALVERARSVIDSGVGDEALRAAARRLVGLPDAEVTAPREGHPFVEPATGMAFVWIPGGRFVMGSSKKRGEPNYDPETYDDETPAHRVQLTWFWMSVYPVTNEVYARFIAETGRAAPESFTDRRFNDPEQPVVTVSWDDTRTFTGWLTGKLAGVVARLPTEAEWEYAARGIDGRRYPWGNEPPDASRATYGQPFGTGRPAAVGHTPNGKSPFEAHDLAGNVCEGCLDAYADGYAEIIKEGSVDPCHQGDTRGGPRVAAAAPGASFTGTCAPPAASGSIPSSGAGTSAFGWCVVGPASQMPFDARILPFVLPLPSLGCSHHHDCQIISSRFRVEPRRGFEVPGVTFLFRECAAASPHRSPRKLFRQRRATGQGSRSDGPAAWP